jgi:alanine or glycine:cation symporter, AGCS family
MYYLNYGLRSLGYAKLGRGLGGVYAVGILLGALGIGNLFQSNQAYEQLVSVWGEGVSPVWVGLILAVLVLGVILGGIQSIAKVTEKVVPFMAVLYCVSALTVIAFNIAYLPAAVQAIFTGAFTGEGVTGGALGVMVIGFQRAVFSNEAGIGSASIAHSAVKTDEPITEGVVSLLEPFIDTIVICTITALVITTSQLADPHFAGEAKGVAMTSAAFARHISWFPYPLAVAAVLFALSTMISWSYYGLKGWTYLFGEGVQGQAIYKVLFCFFVFLGPLMKLDPILDISDALVFLICVPNIFGLYLLAPIVKAEMRSYFERIASGEIKKYK